MEITVRPNACPPPPSLTPTAFKDCVVHGDRVLHQIDKNRDLFNDETHSISGILLCLRPWMKLDEDKGNASVLKDRAEPQVLRDLVDLLLERKNRVWARLFLHNLSGYQEVKPEVHEWAQQLNNAGKMQFSTVVILHSFIQLDECLTKKKEKKF